METRIFHTRFWKDSYVLSLDSNEKLFFAYILTNEANNLIGCYELSDEVIQFETRLNKSEIQRIKLRLENDNKVIFAGDWIFMVNHEKYQKYNNPTHIIAKVRLWSLVPGFVKEKLDSLSIGYGQAMHSPKIQNTKYKDKNTKIKIQKELDNNSIKILSDKKTIQELKEKFPIADVEEELEKMKDWLASSGKKKKNYIAFARNWLRKTKGTLNSNDLTHL